MIAAAEAIQSAPASPPPTEAQIISDLRKTVSPSRLTLFLSCRLKFFFRYVLGLTKPKSAALHVGTCVHAVIKSWNKARWKQQPLTLKQLHDEFSKAWTDEAEEPVQWDEDEKEEDQKALGWRLVETYLRENKTPADVKPEAVEVYVEADLHKHGLPNIVGVLDLVQAGVIVDYKTSGKSPNVETVAHTHEIQTSSYAVLYRDATSKRESGIEIHHLIKTKAPKVIISPMPPMSDQQQTRLFHLMEAYQDGLGRKDFVPSVGMQCSSCEFLGECRKWS
ncbi:MAG: PD-(D/E)XK nuclease family protein [Chthoniobacteraceae bacterium]